MTALPVTSSSQNWISRNGWLLSAVWLVFLVPTLIGILTGESIGTGGKVLSTVLLLAFAAVYIDGFRRQQQTDVDPDRAGEHWTGSDTSSIVHFAALVSLAVVLCLVAGVGSLGVMPFVVSFAAFQFPWPAVWAVFAAGLVATVAIPLAAGRLGEFWFLSLIVAGVGGAAVLVRLFEGHRFDQAHLRTRLAIGDERTRVARDVHDVLGHSLTAVILKVELCQRLLGDETANDPVDRERVQACREQLAELESISRQALTEIRSTVGGLRATDVGDEVTAARTVLADAGVDLLVTGDVVDIAEAERSMVAWVVREAVTNIVRHAKAEHCEIELAPAPGVLLRVSDDGVGLGNSGEGNGLTGLRERVTSAGGALRVESPALVSEGVESAGGTTIEVAV
ncbi:MAG: sensor histidine kinase [Acidimicrobiales bacterium]